MSVKRRVSVWVTLVLFAVVSFSQGITRALTSDDVQHIINNTANFSLESDSNTQCGGDSSSGGTTVLPGGDKQQQVFNYFVGKGLSDVQAAAITGNFIVESSLDTSANQPGGPGMGIGQWSNPGRWNNLEKFAAQQGKDKFDLGLQLDFVWAELNGTPPAGDYSHVLTKLKSQTDITDATGFFMGTGTFGTSLWQPTSDDQAARDFAAKYGNVPGYEDPGVPHLNDRITAAQQILNKFGGSSSGAVSGSDSSCNSVGSVNCSSAAQGTAAGDSSTGGLSQLRQNVVCLTKQELALWTSGQMKAGHDFFKYSQNNDQLWCADFASWIYWKAGYPIGPSSANWRLAAVTEIQDVGRQNTKFHYHDRSSYTPKPGDLVIHLDGESHVNIVVSVNTNSSTMTLVGGDQHGSGGADGNVVNSYSESINTGSDGITGYVSPD